MKLKFSLNGTENSVNVESNDLKDLVYNIEKEILRIGSEKSSQVKNEQFLISVICEALCRDADSEEIDLGELAG